MELLITVVALAIVVWIAAHFIAPIVGLLVAIVAVAYVLLALAGRARTPRV